MSQNRKEEKRQRRLRRKQKGTVNHYAMSNIRQMKFSRKERSIIDRLKDAVLIGRT